MPEPVHLSFKFYKKWFDFPSKTFQQTSDMEQRKNSCHKGKLREKSVSALIVRFFNSENRNKLKSLKQLVANFNFVKQ